MKSQFEYKGVENNVMIFQEKGWRGRFYQFNRTPLDEVEMLEGDRVRFRAEGDFQRRTYSIREQRQVE